MSSHLLPRTVFLGPCLFLLGTLCLASGGGTGTAKPEPAPVSPLAHRPLPAPAAPTFSTAVFRTEFEVKAYRFGFSVSRDVSVRARLDGLHGLLEVELDREVKPMFGVDELSLTLHLLDDRGREVEQIETRVPPRTRSFEIPLSLPEAGCYELVMADHDLAAGPARLEILPAGEIRMPIRATRIGALRAASALIACCGDGPGSRTPMR
jgi:hypothetical protein